MTDSAVTSMEIDLEEDDGQPSDPTRKKNDRKAKDFYKAFFTSPTSARESKNSKIVVINYGHCKLCKKGKPKSEKKISAQDGYSNFKTHVLKLHGKDKDVSNFLKEGGPKTAKPDSTLDDYVVDMKKKRLGRKHSKQIRLDEAVARIQVETLIAPTVLGHSSFDRAIQVGDAGLQWPIRHRIVRTLLPRQHRKIKEKLQSLLTKAVADAINLDIWSSKRMRGYRGISVHFIDEKFRLRNLSPRMPEILNLAVEVIADFNLQHKVFYVGTDNGSNIVAAFKDLFPQFYEFSGASNKTDEEGSDTQIEPDDESEIASDDELDLEPLDPEELNTESGLANEVADLMIQKYCLLPDRKILVRCVAHSLQLVLKKPVARCAVVHKAVEALASVVSSVRHSVGMTEKVEEEFGKALKARCATR
ncbi:hypothetical protein RvY_18016 [Ramazzottius varieornatus]|uniref:Uncharacterized protein n=1 Tax=Ramazzottius varieornatus TaxID=947166 RepID=A0A1D1W4D5_RAMVA|nr:hypothetical protein RvY_18016 [Ramazzottius varieornatus]